jgi:hypothetical protein
VLPPPKDILEPQIISSGSLIRPRTSKRLQRLSGSVKKGNEANLQQTGCPEVCAAPPGQQIPRRVFIARQAHVYELLC